MSFATELRYLAQLRGLPIPVARFHWRARRLARRTSDRFSLTSATRAADLGLLLTIARGRKRVVELGTGTAWTAVALALEDPERHVISYDPIAIPERERYLRLVEPSVRSRIELVRAAGSSGPRSDEPVDLLYVDSSHMREQTVEELYAWMPVMRTGSTIAFDDYGHPDFPGVREAVEELGLAGVQRGTLFVHELGSG
jgi:predicted O-methyltransferase YrrM